MAPARLQAVAPDALPVAAVAQEQVDAPEPAVACNPAAGSAASTIAAVARAAVPAVKAVLLASLPADSAANTTVAGRAAVPAVKAYRSPGLPERVAHDLHQNGRRYHACGLHRTQPRDPASQFLVRSRVCDRPPPSPAADSAQERPLAALFPAHHHWSGRDGCPGFRPDDLHLCCCPRYGYRRRHRDHRICGCLDPSSLILAGHCRADCPSDQDFHQSRLQPDGLQEAS